MNSRSPFRGLVPTGALLVCSGWICLAAADKSAALTGPREASSPPAPLLEIKVDPRVELMSIIFRLAGNREYSQGQVASYTADVEKHFASHRDHAVVRLARALRNSRGVSYDACMSMAVHLTDTRELKLRAPLTPWPEGLDTRWTEKDANRFLAAAREFTREANFSGFLERHQELYQLTESRSRRLMDQEAHLEWFGEYFGARPGASFMLVPALLNGGSCYGARCGRSGAKEELYCMLGVWRTDSRGEPEFTRDMLGTVVHEFAHSYANPVIGKHGGELDQAGGELFRHVSEKMRSQAYGNGRTLLYESLVRACEVRYAWRYDGPAAGRRSIEFQKARGFLWMEELSELLANYEARRDQYPTLDAFAPRLVSFFQDYAKSFAAKQAALAAQRPKIVSMTPRNGARDVDPSLARMEVVFDRPMRDGSWSVVGDRAKIPEGAGQPRYDAARKVWTLPVRLKPEFTYEFMLNSESYNSFRSADGVPLEPVRVTFTTGGGK